MGPGTGTGAPVPLATLFHLFLLSETSHRQPRAVYKYWAPCRLYFPLRPLVSGSHLFDVSLQRLLWVEPFVFSAMLGSTVALRDASWSFSN